MQIKVFALLFHKHKSVIIKNSISGLEPRAPYKQIPTGINLKKCEYKSYILTKFHEFSRYNPSKSIKRCKNDDNCPWSPIIILNPA